MLLKNINRLQRIQHSLARVVTHRRSHAYLLLLHSLNSCNGFRLNGAYCLNLPLWPSRHCILAAHHTSLGTITILISRPGLYAHWVLTRPESHLALHSRLYLAPKIWGDGGGAHWLVRIEWHPARWSVCLPLLISPCTVKSRSSLPAPAHPGGPRWSEVSRV